MEPIRVARSFVASDALAELVAQDYDFGGKVKCSLFSKMLRTQDNDHYKVITATGERYVARVYQQGSHLERRQSDYQYELDWLNFLHKNNMGVSYPIPRRDGNFLGSMLAPEGIRYYALFSFAQGLPMDEGDADQLFAVGRQMAQIHKVSNDYQPPFQRLPMDLDYLVKKPLARVQKFWQDDPDRADDLDLIMALAQEAQQEIQAIIDNPHYTEDSWGPIGGDFHVASTYFDAAGEPTFFNFDLCGMGWRAYDIASFLLNTGLMQQELPDSSEAFFAGYYQVRPLSENEHAAISPFLTIRRVWLTSLFTATEGLMGHTFIGPA